MKTLAFRARRLADVPGLAPFLMFAGFFALRLPFRSEYLVNWDAVNFALGTQQFNLETHQPHPPGYIGYVFAGRLLNYFTGDANASLTLMSMVAGAAAPVAFYLLASLFVQRRYAFATAVLFGLSPVVWYYSEVALTYAVEVVLALFFLWSAFTARRDGSRSHLLLATLLLVLIGAVRQSGALFLFPLWIYVAWSFPWRQRFVSGLVVVGGSLAWLVPLLWLSGGLSEYLRISAELADTVVRPTSVFSLDTQGVVQNFGMVMTGVILGVNVGLLVILVGFHRRVNLLAAFAPHRTFFALWLAPVLLTYVLIHTGQLGYSLLLLPAPFLLVASSVAGMCAQREATARSLTLTRRAVSPHVYLVGGLIVALCFVNTVMFMFFPRAINTLATPGEPGAVQSFLFDISSEPLRPLPGINQQIVVLDRTRQFDLQANDRHWESLFRFVKAFSPEQVAVLTIPNWDGSFRHLAYYLPDYRVYGIRQDLNGSFGLLFKAYNGTTNYTIEGLQRARHALRVPPTVQLLIIPDRELALRLQGVVGIEITETTLDSGAKMFMAWLPRDTTLIFNEP